MVKKEKNHKKEEHHKKHAKHERKHVKHHAKHPHHKQKKHGLFSKVSTFFHEAVKIPPVESEVQEVIEKVEVPEVKPEPKPVPIPVVKREDLPEIPTKLPEEAREEIISEHAPEVSELLGNLHSAAQNWRKSGELGIHFEPPVSLRERISGFLGKIKKTPVTVKLEKKSKEVTEKVVERVAKAEAKGIPVKPKKIIKEEWEEVMERVEKTSTSKEREEIEKIYKQLEEN